MILGQATIVMKCVHKYTVEGDGDAEGSIYVAEIGGPGQGQRLQKFARV